MPITRLASILAVCGVFVMGIPLFEWYSMVVNIHIDTLDGSVEDLHLFIFQASIWKFVDKHSD